MRFLDAISNPYVSRFLLSSGLGMMSGQNIGSSMLAGLGSADEERQRRLREELARKEMELKKKQQESYEELKKIQQESLGEQRRASREYQEERLELSKESAEAKKKAIERDLEFYEKMDKSKFTPTQLFELQLAAGEGALREQLNVLRNANLATTRMDIGYQAGLTGARAGASEGVKGTVRAEQSREDLFDEELADIKTNTRIEMLNDPKWKDRPFDPEFSIELTRRAVRALYREKGWAPKKYDEYLGIAVRKPRMVGSVPPDMEWETWR